MEKTLTESEKVEQWEYKTMFFTNLTDSQLNDFGKEGWQLTAVALVYAPTRGRDSFNYYFKRQLRPFTTSQEHLTLSKPGSDK